MAPTPPSIGPYRVLRKLGEGGMGEVFEAVHRTIERQVAIKILRSAHAGNPSINQRFLNEARAVNLIKHPGLVQISDFGQLADGSPYIVMEYLHGETLRQRLRRLQLRLPLEQVLHTLWQVASALVATHDAGIVHRDRSQDPKVCLHKAANLSHRRRTDHVDGKPRPFRSLLLPPLSRESGQSDEQSLRLRSSLDR